jgi:SH3 domain-containing YSC84-like protein 1
MRSLRLMTALLLAGGLAASPALAATSTTMSTYSPNAKVASNEPVTTTVPANNTNRTRNVATDRTDAHSMLNQASAVVKKMQGDPNLVRLMKQAKGIFIIPEFGRAAFIVGGRAGGGVLLQHVGAQWSNPAFFNMGGGSLGFQIGVSGGPVALLIMSQKAMDSFRGGANWSLNAAAGFNIVNYSAVTPQASWGKGGDVVVWSDLSGFYAGAEVNLTDISFNSAFNQALYGTANVRKILANATPKDQYVHELKTAMPSGTTRSAMVVSPKVKRAG